MLNDKRYYTRLFGKWFCECSCGVYHRFVFKSDDSFEWDVNPNGARASRSASSTTRHVGNWYIDGVSQELRDLVGVSGLGIAQQKLVMNIQSNDSHKNIILLNVDGPDGENLYDGNIFDVDGNVKVAFGLDGNRRHFGKLRKAEHADISGVVHMDSSKSLFISYGEPDKEDARKINAYLKRKGIRTWFFEDDALPGEKLHRVMHVGVNTHDRVLLLCSEASLSRPGVMNEIERVLEREAKEGGSDILIPLALDHYVYKDWAPSRLDIAAQVRSRVIAGVNMYGDQDQLHKQLDKVVLAVSRSRK